VSGSDGSTARHCAPLPVRKSSAAHPSPVSSSRAIPFPVAAYRRMGTEYESMKLLALPLAVLAFHGSIQPLRAPLRNQIAAHRWHRGCPVPL